LKTAAYIGGLTGLALLLVLIVHSDFAAIPQILGRGGWQLLWLIPYRSLYFLFYALGWLNLLRPYDPDRHASLNYLVWVTTVREAIDRLLPVASVGGGVVGVRLLRWRGVAAAPAAATVVVEVLLTLGVSYLFALVGVVLLIDLGGTGRDSAHLVLALLLSLPVPVATAMLLRYGSVFARFGRFLRLLVGENALSTGAAAVDRELRACLRRGRSLLVAGTWQFSALLSGTFEIWFVLGLFGHPVPVSFALILESLTQAVRHIAFVVPAALGVQEAGLILFGQALGISSELALAVSMAKRMREVLCGLPSLLSWQWVEARRMRMQLRTLS
jgi:putative membrane protein